MATASSIEKNLGRGEAIAAFVAECEVWLSTFAPELDYRRPDLDGFIRSAWPCGEPVDAAAEFAENIAICEEATCER